MKIKQQEQNNGNTRKTLLLAQLDLQRQPQDTHFKVSKFRWNKALHSEPYRQRHRYSKSVLIKDIGCIVKDLLNEVGFI